MLFNPPRNHHQKTLRNLFADKDLETFKRSTVILAPDDKPNHIYWLDKGNVRAYTLTSSGSRSLHIVYKAGELFPLPDIFTGQPSELYYEAVADVELRCLPRLEFAKHAHQDLEVANGVMEQVLVFFTVYRSHIQTLEYRTATERAASHLLMLGERFGQAHPDGTLIPSPVPHQDIGDSTNLARETVSRVLESMGRAGMIAQANQTILLKQIPELSALL